MTQKEREIINFLIRLIEEKSDFPGMTRTVNLVAEQTSKQKDVSITELTNTILDDFALTNKLLKMVNSVFYIKYQTTGKVNTISRAVHILGFNRVRNAALSLMLLEKIHNKTLVKGLQESFVTAFMNGVIAGEIAKTLGEGNREEAFICGVYHDLGKLLISFYMPSENKKIMDLINHQDIDEHEASYNILGIDFEAVGVNIARHWHFADQIVYSMKKLSLKNIPAPNTTMDMYRCISSFSNNLCSIIGNIKANPAKWKKDVKAIMEAYESCFTLTEENLYEILDSSLHVAIDYADNLHMDLSDSGFLRNINKLLKEEHKLDGTTHKIIDIDSEKPSKKGNLLFLDIDDVLPDQDTDKSNKESQEEILSKGIMEIANTLLEDYSLNDILRMILEVIFRGMSFHRALICINNAKAQTMGGRFGFGPEIDRISKQFKFSINSKKEDVFNIALKEDADILIRDSMDTLIRPRIPEWYKELLDSKTFVLIPITVLKVPLGLIYGDKQEAGDIKIESQILMYLKTLKNQACLAIKQRMR